MASSDKDFPASTTGIPSAPVLATFGITRDEMEALDPFLVDFKPGYVADVIWDAITDIGFDDVAERVGVFFARENSSLASYQPQTEDSQTTVVFWDKEGPMKLPKKAFLQIVELVAIVTLSSPSEKPADPSLSEEDREYDQAMYETGRYRLRTALGVLQEKISSNHSFDHSLSYRFSFDSGFEDSSNFAGLVQETQCRWDHGVHRNTRQRRGSDPTDARKRWGVEGVLEGLSVPRERRGSLNDRIRAKLAAVREFKGSRGRKDSGARPTDSKDVKFPSGKKKLRSIEEEMSNLSLERIEEGSAVSVVPENTVQSPMMA